MATNDVFFAITELENKVKKLEKRFAVIAWSLATLILIFFATFLLSVDIQW